MSLVVVATCQLQQKAAPLVLSSLFPYFFTEEEKYVESESSSENIMNSESFGFNCTERNSSSRRFPVKSDPDADRIDCSAEAIKGYQSSQWWTVS